MEVILAWGILGAIVIIAAWKYYSVKDHTTVDPIAPYKVEPPVSEIVSEPEPVVEREAIAPVAKPAKIKAKKQKAPAVVAEAVVAPVKAKRTRSKKI